MSIWHARTVLDQVKAARSLEDLEMAEQQLAAWDAQFSRTAHSVLHSAINRRLDRLVDGDPTWWEDKN